MFQVQMLTSVSDITIQVFPGRCVYLKIKPRALPSQTRQENYLLKQFENYLLKQFENYLLKYYPLISIQPEFR
jgi:hypothetical protein